MEANATIVVHNGPHSDAWSGHIVVQLATTDELTPKSALVGPEQFDYHLPPEHIAQQPSARRGDARMLIVGDEPTHAHVRDLPHRLPDNALVVVNESKVVPARLHAVRDDGRSFELLVCAPRAGQRQVRAWVRGARRLKEGDRLQVGGLIMRASGTDAIDRRARLFEVVDGDVLEACEHHGIVPLPPYIERPPLPEDRQRYQTVYAGPPGSVAAPTAGLHLEPEMIAALEVVRIVLHVGPGTFLPMEVSDVADHRVGEEHVEIDVEAAARIRAAQNAGRPIVAVGTTVTRALESVARERGEIVAMRGSTRLVITPGFDFRVVTHLLTNFHLPRSSLLMLVCAFGGMARVMAAYRQAITAGYRFYSYGDCMLCPADPNHRRS